MELKDAIYHRRALREFAPKPVDQTTLRSLIDAAVQGPSAVNQQPWMFTVVRDQSVLDRISLDAKTHMRANMPVGPLGDHLQVRLSDPDFHIFYHAPALILISAEAQGPWIVEDCALAAENLMLSAYAAGLGSCWIGFAQGFLNTQEGKATLGLPAACVPVAPIIVGYPKVPAPPVARKEPKVRWIGF